MAEAEFVLSIEEQKAFEVYCIQRALELVRGGMSLVSAGDAILKFAGQWAAEWRYEQTKKGPDFRLGSLAKRAFDSEAAKQNTPSTPPIIGNPEFGPGEVNDTAQITTAMVGWMIPILSEIIDSDFSPASGIKAARNSLEALRAIRRGEGTNEYGLLSESFMTAVQRAPFGYRESDLKRAAELAIENLRIMLGATDQAPRDLSARNFVELVLRGHDNVFARHKGTPKTPAQVGSLVARGIGSREPRVRIVKVKNGPRGRRGTVGIREAVRNTLGIKTPAGYHEIQVEVR